MNGVINIQMSALDGAKGRYVWAAIFLQDSQTSRFQMKNGEVVYSPKRHFCGQRRTENLLMLFLLLVNKIVGYIKLHI